MIESTLFCENFWGEKHQGFDVLSQNMKIGLKSTTEFLEFLREVYSTEDSSMKSWIKLSKQINGSSLQPIWMCLKDLSEKRSTVHLEMGLGIQVIIKSVQKYIEEQQIKQKATKDIDIQTQNFNNLLVTTANQVMRAKESYHNRYIELHKLNLLELNTAAKTREMEKMETKLKKAVDEYKYLIEKYNNTCLKYKSKMNESCKNFQDIETYHLEQMKGFVCKLGQNLLKSQTDLLKHQKEFLANQEMLTVELLLKSFINSKATGKTPPKLIIFEEPDTTSTIKLNKVNSDSGINDIQSNDAVTGNLVNIDSWSDISSAHVSNLNLDVVITKDNLNDVFDRISNMSDNNSINQNTAVVIEPVNAVQGMKKAKKYNNIFRRKRNSPINGGNSKSLQDLDKEKSSQSLGDFIVDEEGYSIKPADLWNGIPHDTESDSSSVDDPADNTFKGIKVEIKPQETKSNSSSIPDNDYTTKAHIDENLDLIKAVQAIKLIQPGTKDSLRRLTEHRSHTPSLVKDSKERYSSQSSSEKDFCQFSIRDSRTRKSNSQLEQKCKQSQPNFSINFETSFDAVTSDNIDPFSQKFEALTKIKDGPIPESESDPWGCKPSLITSPQPPLPAKITPPKASSVLPFNHQKISELFRIPVIPPLGLKMSLPPNRANVLDGIPLAISFTETVDAKFREPFSTKPHDVHTNGQLVVSFPSTMVQQLDSLDETQLKSIEPLHFTLVRATRLRNVELIPANKDIVLRIENPSEDLFSIYLDLLSVQRKLTSQLQKEPFSPFFNIEIIKYDVTNNVRSSGSINAPLYLSANWQFADPLTSHLIINYNFQWPNTNVGSLTFRPPTALSNDSEPEIQPRGEVRFLVTADGSPHKMQSLPACVWNSELSRASWRLDLSSGKSSIKSKFFLNNGPGTPQPVICQFSAEGAIESGVLLQVSGNRFRISRHKYSLISGKYMWEPSPATVSGSCL